MARQAEVKHLFPKLKFKVGGDKHRKLSNPDGPAGRIRKIQKTLTALFKYERIELNFNRADETRGYVELLIDKARKNGPHDKETMEFADFYILEKQLVHKLFKVLVPRYENYTDSFTSFYMVPRECPGHYFQRSVLELKGNIYPSLEIENPNTKNMIHNVLLDAAKKEYRYKKYKEIAKDMENNSSPSDGVS
ncbi:39S ribosomal protein L17, mitochondrial [Leptopilina boulardi]|uniref:39S ribosomal protein L17, mitochondrial n=1 Tax=Leptopilina boulardi TaxID=63433 RepID=UPI0021F5C0E4|nr:39S ribosomal protein L17, mitochondrial [Leptopilina boulardi]